MGNVSGGAASDVGSDRGVLPIVLCNEIVVSRQLFCYRSSGPSERLIQIHRRMVLGSHAAFCAILQSVGLSGRIQTSYIERLNVDLRSDIAALTRRTNALVRSSKQLSQVMTLWQGYHNLCRSHRSLKLHKSVQPDAKLRDRTTAMAANIVDRVWSFERFLRTLTFPALAEALKPSPC